jgi:hypothetical protein
VRLIQEPAGLSASPKAALPPGRVLQLDVLVAARRDLQLLRDEAQFPEALL